MNKAIFKELEELKTRVARKNSKLVFMVTRTKEEFVMSNFGEEDTVVELRLWF